MDDWEEQQYEDFGFHFGRIFRQILLGGAKLAQTPDTFNIFEAVKFVRYITKGFFDKKIKIRLSVRCLKPYKFDLEHIPQSIDKALGHIACKTEKDAREALREISLVVELVRSVLARCGASQQDVEKLEEALQRSQLPSAIVYTSDNHLIIKNDVRDVDFTYWLDEIEVLWRNRKYKDFGRFLGNMYEEIVRHALQRDAAEAGGTKPAQISEGEAAGAEEQALIIE